MNLTKTRTQSPLEKLAEAVRRRRNAPQHGATAGLAEDPSARLLQLTKGQFAIVDADMFDELNHYSWFSSIGYAARYRGANLWPKVMLMHRYILGVPQGLETDHINGNRLDNRRANLRIATHTENGRNRKTNRNNPIGVKGVYKRGDKFASCICANGKVKHLGLFSTLRKATTAYNLAAATFHGEFARPNRL